jgi:hypothetical protein
MSVAVIEALERAQQARYEYVHKDRVQKDPPPEQLQWRLLNLEIAVLMLTVALEDQT